ncbi:MAG: hypothetical protein Kow00114_00970 [Kiloniellaceae bacterium]
MGGLSPDKAAAMRRAFFDDLERRLDDIAAVAAGLDDGALARDEARAAVLAQLHDIKGCGAPYGVPAATDLAREYERRFAQPARGEVFSGETLLALIAEFQRLMV